MRKRIFSKALALLMILSLLPVTAFATGLESTAPDDTLILDTEPDSAPQVDAALQADGQTETQSVATGTLKVFYYDAINDSNNQEQKEGWNVDGGTWEDNNYYKLKEIEVPLDILPTKDLPNKNNSMTLDPSANEALVEALQEQLDNIEWEGPKPTVSLDLVTLGKLSNQGNGVWHLDVTYNDVAKAQDSVYVYMDTTLGSLPEEIRQQLSGLGINSLTDLYKNKWATLGKIERIDLTSSDSIDWDTLMAEYLESYVEENPDPNFTACKANLTAVKNLLESLTWKLTENNSGANYGSSGNYVPVGKMTTHLDGTITCYTVSYGNEIDGVEATDIGTKTVLKNMTIGELQSNLEGYTFGGWYLADGTPFDLASTKITADTKLIARWTSPVPEEPEILLPVEFSVDFTADAGTTTIEDEETPLAGLLTRADAIGYLWEQTGSPEADLSDFADVPEDHYWAAAIGWAQDKGIALPDEEGNFRPDDLVLRTSDEPEGELQEFLNRYAVFAGIALEEGERFITLEGEAGDILMGEEAQAIFDQFFAELDAALEAKAA